MTSSVKLLHNDKPSDRNPETTKTQQWSSSQDQLPKHNASTRHMTMQITNDQSNKQPPLKSNVQTMLPPIQPSHCVLFNLFFLLKPQPHAILLLKRTKTRLCIVQIVELVKNRTRCPLPWIVARMKTLPNHYSNNRHCLPPLNAHNPMLLPLIQPTVSVLFKLFIFLKGTTCCPPQKEDKN
jgi:hypothetical protein